MSLLPNKFTELLFKPKWQHKDAAIRRTAVQEAQHLTLVQELPRIAREDEDHRVRLAALRRVNDFSLYRDRAANDPDPALRSVARTQYLGILCGEIPAQLETSARLRELGIIESSEDIEHIALRAQDAVLRRAALERVGRISLIAERAVGDPDAGLRQYALERIDDTALLTRIAEKTRKTDKLISRLARARADAQRIASGDNAAIDSRARSLCERIEALLRNATDVRGDDLQQIESAWNAFSAQVPESFRQRYAVAYALLAQGVDRATKRPVVGVSDEDEVVAEAAGNTAPVNVIEPVEASERLAEVDPEVQAEALRARANFEAALASARAETQREREQQQALSNELKELAEQYAKALEAGDTGTARRLRNAIAELRQRMRGSVPPAIEQALLQQEARFNELAQWQIWANSKRRRQLCEDIETLQTAALHPDAVANKVRDARNEWQKLDAAEGMADTATPLGVTRRFQALCQQAIKPTRVYFDKREEVRKSHQEQIEALLARTDAIGEESEDWKQIFNLRRDATLALRGQLDSVDPRQRTALAKRLKDAMSRLGAKLEAHELAVEQAKVTLITKANALNTSVDSASATREVRELQKRWQATGVGKRRTDQKQWEQFRAACDAIFGNLDAARQQREAISAAMQLQAEALCAELESLCHAIAQGETEARARQREIDTQWRELGNVERNVQARYHNAQEAAQAAAEKQQRERRHSRYTNAQERYLLLRDLENGKLDLANAQTGWDALPLSAREFAPVLNARFERALHTEQGISDQNAAAETAERFETAQDLLIQIEFLAGLDSPPEERQRRMDYQVSRLSSRLRGGSSENIETELTGWLVHWFALDALSVTQNLDMRYSQALQVLLAQLP